MEAVIVRQNFIQDHIKSQPTFRTPKWKSPCPAVPDAVDKFGVGFFTTCSGAASLENSTASVLLVQSTRTAKLCHETGVNGVAKRTFNAWSSTLNECAFGTGSGPVGFVNGEPVSEFPQSLAF